MSDWIKCSEQMPEHGMRVLCWMNVTKPHSVILFYKSEKKSDRDSHFPPIRDDLITHWQPLPEPPQ